jgi:hypothetical protein
MAYQFFRFSPKSSKTFREYNIDFAVGPSSQNRRDDVMLVQLLLRMVYNENKSAEIAAALPKPADLAEIKPDGFYGPTTAKYIALFKDQTRALGVELYPDQVMDPFRDNEPDSISTISKTSYALGKLMNSAARADEARFDGLVEHPDTPDLLRNALQQVRDQALQYQSFAAAA